MASPTDRKYTTTHEWVLLDGSQAGVTSYRVQLLGSVTAITLPTTGSDVTKGQTCGSLSGSNSSADFHAPIGGAVPDRNEWLADGPSNLTTSNAYGTGWLINLSPSNLAADLADLMPGPQYDAYIASNT